MQPKPPEIFARDDEWQYLAKFAERTGTRPKLGVVSGRRRQGKTFLLVSLAQQSGAFYFSATQATERDSLTLFSAALAEHLGTSAPFSFDSWDAAIKQLFAIFAERRELVVIDEFPYLSKVSPALPSIIQREIDRAVSTNAPVSLLLCGSVMSVMGRLLAGNAPLRGRAVLEMVLRPFDFRLAADYWGTTDRRLAAMTHAIVGGTPAYLPFVEGDVCEGLGDFDDWVRRTVLNPNKTLFREARYLLGEQVEARDTAMYQSVLAAVATGNCTRGAIASHVGRKVTDIGHYLNVLEDCHLLRREPDVFRPSRSVFRVCEPLIHDVSDTVLTCYSGVGFDGSLAREGDVRAVGLAQLYG
ncbi:AAA family ATPase [Nonomuraea gerenzanensis]|uniref:Archaeal ATPase, fused to C-terminal DUF234 domain n=1 Tax=Nonomuraea gerenzanensis TaxID=93944 RepID=A0A1M4ENU8_9ACTN|nr:ATP-binding protein [Nonomuraea gerenzanensis]UBU11970.1 ATP-binding protein [Nonomuraea gerenzanensis]SBP00485.1 archaeal ATPase, fused to C-terminal DUF234 domain [Nonomuraea gerenzanensis]